MEKIIEILKKKWLQKGLLTGLLVFIILAAFVVFNRLIFFADLSPMDFTEDRIYSLSDTTKDAISKIEQNVNIYVFGFSQNSTVGILVKQYQKLNDKMQVKFVNTQERVDLAQEYNIAETDTLIAIESSQQYKAIDRSELYKYDVVDNIYYDVTEQKLTNAILEVTMPISQKVYFLTGHGEYDIEADTEFLNVANAIKNEVYEISTVDLLTEDIPADCSALIIASPTKDFVDSEVNKLIDYIHKGGNILWMQDPYISSKVESHVNIDKVLAEYGIKFSEGLVLESTEGTFVTNLPDIILPRLVYNNIVKDLYRDGNVVLLDSGKIEIDEDALTELKVSKEDFIKTTSGAYYKENLSSGNLEKEDGDVTGTYILGEILTKKVNDNKSSKLVAIANGTFVTSEPIYMGTSGIVPSELRNNKDLVLNSVMFLTGRDNVVRVRKNTGVVGFGAVEDAQKNVVKIIIFAVPIAIIIAGIVITIIKRKNR